jgi:uncharacterized membrane protein
LDQQILSGTAIAVMLMIACFYLLFPRIGRRGLLFGVYVGEEAGTGEPARRLNARWTRAILAWTVLAFVGYAIVSRERGPLAGYVTGLFGLLAGYFVEYLRSYRAARALAPELSPAPAVAFVTEAPRPVAAWVALAFSVVAGLVAVGYTAIHRGELGPQVPMHFDIAGRPDAWRPSSFGSVWMLPWMTLMLGTTLSGIALLTAHAKRAVRRDGGRSLAAQQRFRAATSTLLAASAFLTAGLLAVTSIGAVRVATGRSDTLPPVVPVLSILLAGVAVAGTAFLGLRFGQGGARLEAGEPAPLTNGIADNSRWALGLFYFDPQDPSIFVEKRFGLGYTLNFGNWKAVAGLVLFLLLLLAGPQLVR